MALGGVGLARIGLLLAWMLLGAAPAWSQPANDQFANSFPLVGTSITTSGSNVGATREVGEPLHHGNSSPATVWWHWTAASSGTVFIDTFGSNFDTVLAAYTGSAVNALSTVDSDDDTNGLQSRVNFEASAGTTYRIAVAGFGSSTGSIVLNLAAGNPAPRVSSNPAPGSILNFPAGGLSTSTQLGLDLIATGGGAGATTQIQCSGNSGVRVGAAGASPAGTSFNQAIDVGEQPVDLAVAVNVTAGSQAIANGLVCTIVPSLGASYPLNYSIAVPPALPANAPPQLTSLPPSGSTIVLRPAAFGGPARGSIDLAAVPGAGSGSLSALCTGSGGVRVGIDPPDFGPNPPPATSWSFGLGATDQPADLILEATVGASDVAGSLSCVVTPSSGAGYALNYDISIPAAIDPTQGTWEAQGPTQVAGGQSEGITVPRVRPVAGAIHVLAPHPTDADVLYVGAVNGGVWRTLNATAPDPDWVRLTDTEQSLSMGALDLDPTDGAAQTLVAGIGRFSSYGRTGGGRAGLLRTTDGGASWSPLDGSMQGRNISGVVARGSIIVASVDIADSFTCANIGLFRSTNGGSGFTRLTAAQGFPSGGVDAVVGSPADSAVMYASLEAAGVCAGNTALNGIYRSADSGATWSKVSNAAMDALMNDGNTSGYLVRIQVAPDGAVVVAIANGVLLGVFHSANQGASWTTMGTPVTLEGTDPIGIHPGGQGSLHLSVAIDAANSNLVYVGGDRQPTGAGGGFPNSLGALDFSGRLFRGDVTVAAPNTWSPLTHGGTASFGAPATPGGSAPHADSRRMAFDAAGRLIEVDDGGIYARTSPATAEGDWIGLNGNLQVTEQHSLAFDRVSRVALSGNQDNGTMRQQVSGLPPWRSISGGDGGGVAVDHLLLAATSRAVSYSSFQNLLGFARRTYDASNSLVTTEFPSLIVTGIGPSPVGQFVTPIVTNRARGGGLAIGAANGVYESFDSGATLILADEGLRAQSFPTTGSLAYGAIPQPDVLYVAGCRGSCSAGADDGLFRRATPGSASELRRANAGGFEVVGVALDPNDADQVFIYENSSSQSMIQWSQDGGASWTPISAGLPVGAGLVRAMRFLPPGSFGSGVLAVGTDRGVFVASRGDDYASWSEAGTGLPNAPVYWLDYDESQDLLFAGTLGRGAFSLRGVVVRLAEGGGQSFSTFFKDGFEVPPSSR